MICGDLVPSEIKFVHLGKETALVNGQHRLTALAECGLTQEFTAIHIEVDSPLDIARIYSLEDFTIKNRNIRDSLRAFDFADKFKVTERDMALLTGAAVVVEQGFNFSANLTDRDLRTRSAIKYGPLAHLIFNTIRGNSEVFPMLTRRNPLAVMLATFADEEEKATNFWGSVSQDESLAKGSPEKTLLTWLRVKLRENKGHKVQCRACAVAWNANFEGRSIGRIQNIENDNKVALLGTKFII